MTSGIAYRSFPPADSISRRTRSLDLRTPASPAFGSTRDFRRLGSFASISETRLAIAFRIESHSAIDVSFRPRPHTAAGNDTDYFTKRSMPAFLVILHQLNRPVPPAHRVHIPIRGNRQAFPAKPAAFWLIPPRRLGRCCGKSTPRRATTPGLSKAGSPVVRWRG